MVCPAPKRHRRAKCPLTRSRGGRHLQCPADLAALAPPGDWVHYRDVVTNPSLVQPTSPENALAGIGLKIASVFAFMVMASAIKLAGQLPPGQMVFFRSFFAIIPICVYLLMSRQFLDAWKTERVGGHVIRGLLGVAGMSLGFYGLTHLPLTDAIAIGYARPLVTVVLGALILGEVVRRYRWGAVLVGFAGVMIISWPKLELLRGGGGDISQAFGAIATLAGAVVAGFATVLVRSLVATEKTTTIVLYASITASLIALLTVPLGWSPLDPMQATALVTAGVFGGLGQILLTQSYRHAETSTIAPFDYTSILLSIAIGILVFSEFPTWHTLVGSAIVIAAGIFIIYREHQLGLKRDKARSLVTPQG